MIRVLMFVCGLAFTGAAQAATSVATDLVKSGMTRFEHAVIDPVTGKVYAPTYYSTSLMTVYDSMTAYKAGTASGTVPLSAAKYGTYSAILDGKLVGRTSNSTSSLGTWDSATGALGATTTVAGMCGSNGACSFDFGGYTAMNILQDQTGTYLLATDMAKNWNLFRVDSALSTSLITTFARTGSNDGFAFMIGGTLFLGASYHDPEVKQSYDVGTGTLSAVDYRFEGIDVANNQYLQSTLYDAANDTLYLFNNGNNSHRTLFQVANAAQAFNVTLPTAQVPVPASVLMLGGALAGLASVRRRSR